MCIAILSSCQIFQPPKAGSIEVEKPTNTSAPLPTNTSVAISIDTPTPINTVSPTETPTQDPNPTNVKLTLITGSDGTVDVPIFELLDNSGEEFSGEILFTISLDHVGDFKPHTAAIYKFTVPYPLCKIAEWHLKKPATSGVNDTWLVKEIHIELNGVLVYFDKLFSQEGPLNSDTVHSGNWAETDFYKQECSNQ